METAGVTDRDVAAACIGCSVVESTEHNKPNILLLKYSYYKSEINLAIS